MEIAISAASGGIVLLLLVTIAQGFRRGEKFSAHPARLAVIVAPFMVLTAEPWLGGGQAGSLLRLLGAGMFTVVLMSVVFAIRAKNSEEDSWTVGDYVLTVVFLLISGLGAAWLLVRAVEKA